MSKPGFNWITPVLCVEHCANSLDHYAKVLGFDIAWQWSEEDAFDEAAAPTFACVCRGEISLFLCEKGQGQPGSWICVNVPSLEDLDTLHQEYLASGADIAEAPEDRTWGMREMVVRDLDGNVMRIGCMLPDQ